MAIEYIIHGELVQPEFEYWMNRMVAPALGGGFVVRGVGYWAEARESAFRLHFIDKDGDPSVALKIRELATEYARLAKQAQVWVSQSEMDLFIATGPPPTGVSDAQQSPEAIGNGLALGGDHSSLIR